MQCTSAKDANYGSGRLIDLARAEPVLVAKHGQPVLAVRSVDEYKILKGSEVGDGGGIQNKSKTAHPAGAEEN